MFKFLILSILAVSVMALPQQAPPAAASSSADASATVLSNSFTDDGAGNFAYNYETSNQIKANAEGHPKQISDPDGKQQQGEVQQGSYSFLAPDGQTYNIEWIADENGFQPKGAHLPVPPAPTA
jgi:hypothetical protein